LANRRYFNERYAEEWARAARNKKPVALIMLDVDRFKSFNDHYGHLGGDDCLKQIAAAIKNMMSRPGDLVARYGGEEFIVLLPDTALDGAAYLAEKIRIAVEKRAIPHEVSDISPYVTISLGVAGIIPDPGTDPNTLIELADQCLYRAKNLGRNQIQTVMVE
jgi:diguanylate cyclase (GGDEF)-like protein